MRRRDQLPAEQRPRGRELVVLLRRDGRRPNLSGAERLDAFVGRTCHACGERFLTRSRRRLYCRNGCSDAVKLLRAGQHLVRAR